MSETATEPKPLEELLADLRAHVSLGTVNTLGAFDTLNAMSKRLRAVAALHEKCEDVEPVHDTPWCAECNDEHGGGVDWPCPTWRALNGQE